MSKIEKSLLDVPSVIVKVLLNEIKDLAKELEYSQGYIESLEQDIVRLKMGEDV